jgi:DNA-directed RNA polymerase specialized sigma24 family protein
MIPRRSRDLDAIWAQLPAIKRALRRSGVPPEAVEDLAQDVLLAAYLGLATGRLTITHDAHGRNTLGAYLRTIAWRVAVDHHRHSQREARGNVAAVGLGTVDPMPQIEARAELARLAAKLTPFERRMFATLGEGATILTLARRAGIPMGTAATRLRTARIRLRARMRRK